MLNTSPATSPPADISGCWRRRSPGGPPGAYELQADIAAVHARAATAVETDWAQIAGVYAILAPIQPTPVVELNRAVAIAMVGALEHGLALWRS